jgi:hypothetical protein
MLQELPCSLFVSRCNELSDSELGRSVDAYEELALGGLHLGDVDVKEPDGVSLELLAIRLFSLDVRREGEVMSPETPMKRRSS